MGKVLQFRPRPKPPEEKKAPDLKSQIGRHVIAFENHGKIYVERRFSKVKLSKKDAVRFLIEAAMYLNNGEKK